MRCKWHTCSPWCAARSPVFKSSYAVKYTKRFKKICVVVAAVGCGSSDGNDESFNNDDVNIMPQSFLADSIHKFLYHLCGPSFVCTHFRFVYSVYVSVWKSVCVLPLHHHGKMLEFLRLLLWLCFGYVNLIDCWRILLHFAPHVLLIFQHNISMAHRRKCAHCLLSTQTMENAFMCYINLTQTIAHPIER